MASHSRANSGPMSSPKQNRVIDKFIVVGDQVHKIHTVIVHQFRMGDVEDPDLYAAEPLMEWQTSEMGEWVMEHALEVPMWNRTVDTASFGHLYYITARLGPKDYTYWSLKWGCLTK